MPIRATATTAIKRDRIEVTLLLYIILLAAHFCPLDFQVAREGASADLAEAVGFGEVFDTDYRHGDLWDTDLRDEHRFFWGFMGHRFKG